MPTVTPFLWFDAPLDEPIAWYRSIFDVRVLARSPMTATIEIEGQRLILLDGGPKYRPKALGRYLGDPDRAKAERVIQAMLRMRKIDVAALDRAAAAS